MTKDPSSLRFAEASRRRQKGYLAKLVLSEVEGRG